MKHAPRILIIALFAPLATLHASGLSPIEVTKLPAFKGPTSGVKREIDMPLLDLSTDKKRHSVVAAGTESVYQGHCDTVLLPDGKTMFTAWCLGHAQWIGPIAKSADAGRTWSKPLDVPKNWYRTSNTPALHRLVAPDGRARLFCFGEGLNWSKKGKPPYPLRQAYSEDDGQTWTPMIPNGVEGEVPPKTIHAFDKGKRLVMWSDLPGYVVQSESLDGGLTWSPSRRILRVPNRWSQPCVIRSADGRTHLMLLRENSRKYQSLYSVSHDSAKTWTEPRELPATLTGDRHVAKFAPDGRLVVAFRDVAKSSSTYGHYLAWVGRFENIMEGKPGDYRVKLFHNTLRKESDQPGQGNADCGYSDLELLFDGTIIATTYLKYAEGPEKHSVMNTRFKLEETDALVKNQVKSKTGMNRGGGNATAAAQEPGTKNKEPQTKNNVVFRPQAGKFPPLEKAHSYRGELVFVDHANRRGSIRIQTEGKFRFTSPSPFAMLPYGIVRYHGAPADLRDIPLGTMLHVRAFLPPDPKISAVPVLPVNNRTKKAGNAGTGSSPAENHVLLLEDEPSYCQREGIVWRLKEVEVSNNQGMIIASRESRSGGFQPPSVGEKPTEQEDVTDSEGSAAGSHRYEAMTFDAATRIWRGREYLGVQDLIAEGTWPAGGKKLLDDQAVLLGITWKPTPGGVFTRFHISDIWLDDAAMQRAARNQNETHKSFIRSRWMPGWVDAVEYGKFGKAKVRVTLFGGMDDSLYVDFKKGSGALLAQSENTLKHWAGGTAGTAQMASKGPILDVTKMDGEAPLGSSGIQIHFETDLITEGIRPGRVVRIRPAVWPDLHVPREEYLKDSSVTHEDRFPTPAIFPVYGR